MNRNEDLITLDEQSNTPPPVYSQNLGQNRVPYNQTPISHHQNNHLFPAYQQPIQPQAPFPTAPYGTPLLIDVNKLPLSMQRNFHIKNNYPTGYIIFHSISLLIIALAMFSAEMVVLFNANNLDMVNQIGGGLYSGGLLILTVLITLVSISCRNFCMVFTSVLFHLISMVITFIMTVVFHGIGISDMNCIHVEEKCQSDLVGILSSLLIAISFIAIFMCLFFAIFIQSKVVGSCSKKSSPEGQVYQNFYLPQNYQQQPHGFVNPNYANYQQMRH